MEYVLLIYTDESGEPEPDTAEDATRSAEYAAYTEEAGRRGILVAGRALHPTMTATTVTRRDGATLTADGPHADTGEQITGFYLIDVEDLDAAIEAATALPAARYGAVEVRPIRRSPAAAGRPDHHQRG